MRTPNSTGENPGAGSAGQAGAGSGVTPPHEVQEVEELGRVVLGERVSRFSWGGRLEFVARCPPTELVELAERFGARREGDAILAGAEAYRRLLVYAAVRRTLKEEEADLVEVLKELVAILDAKDVFFWSGQFIKVVREYRSALRQVAKTFKLFNGLPVEWV